MSPKGEIGIVGSGVIGRNWAMLFVSAGYRVKVYDVTPIKVDEAYADIEIQLNKFKETGHLKGTLSVQEQMNLIKKCYNLKDCVSGSLHVQESVCEDLDLKRNVYKEMDKFASNDVVLGSSTSLLPASSFSSGLTHKSQVIVVHPINPPYYVPLVEVLPASWTDPDVVCKTKALLIEIGQKPIILKKEIVGFAVNRVQSALIVECYRIFQEGIMSLEDIETAMCDGLGLQYAFVGPLESCHLNAKGMLDYCNRYSQDIFKVSQSCGPNPMIEGKTMEKLNKEICKMCPIEKMTERHKYREACLADLSKLKRSLDERDKGH